ncbi:hypothetical protein EDC01DRAFT_782629 [Geopyxis carbonaria]|nr:hypothetical protein EDC01DRAFT_782629 [Geopyxis carbonaria]
MPKRKNEPSPPSAEFKKQKRPFATPPIEPIWPSTAAATEDNLEATEYAQSSTTPLVSQPLPKMHKLLASYSRRYIEPRAFLSDISQVLNRGDDADDTLLCAKPGCECGCGCGYDDGYEGGDEGFGGNGPWGEGGWRWSRRRARRAVSGKGGVVAPWREVLHVTEQDARLVLWKRGRFQRLVMRRDWEERESQEKGGEEMNGQDTREEKFDWIYVSD